MSNDDNSDGLGETSMTIKATEDYVPKVTIIHPSENVAPPHHDNPLHLYKWKDLLNLRQQSWFGPVGYGLQQHSSQNLSLYRHEQHFQQQGTF